MTETIAISSKGAITRAVQAMLDGGIVAYPTETYYGLGVKFDNTGALQRLLKLKGRHKGQAFPLIAGSAGMLDLIAVGINGTAKGLMDSHWPGPLTILLPAMDGLPNHITINNKVAVRVPGESGARALARSAGWPITATSANPSGQPPAATARDVLRHFPQGIDIILDGGQTPGGKPTTIVDTDGGKVNILRQGGVTL